MDKLRYKKGYKYQVHSAYTFYTGILGFPVSNEFLVLATDGYLTIKSGYAWDGPSGPAVDTSNFIRGSLVHDAIYQLIREGLIPITFKEVADLLLVDVCKEDGMSYIRRKWVYLAVKTFGARAIVTENPILSAPEEMESW